MNEIADQPAPVGAVRFNPFALAIRKALTVDEVIDQVARAPLFDPSERSLPARERQEIVLRLDDFVEPLPRFFDLESRISAIIRAGYARRNPLPVAQQRQLAIEAGLNPADYITPVPITLAPGFSLLGFSGVGKTTATKAILNLHKQIVSHTTFMGLPFLRTQLVWLRVACPPTGGARALLMNIFQGIDSQLGTDYHRRFENSRRTTAELIPNLVEIIHTLGLGILVIDEIQRLVRMGHEDSRLLLDLFTHLRTESHTPVMLIGTPKAMRILNRSFEQGRRNTSLGNVDWLPMENDATWEYFVEQMWRFQWLGTPTELTKELSDALYEWSQGITDMAVKIFKMAQFSVIGSESEKLTSDLFKQVTTTEFAWFVPWIPYLKTRFAPLFNGELDEPTELAKNKVRPSAVAPSLSEILLKAGVKPDKLAEVLSKLTQTSAPEGATSPAKPKSAKKAAELPSGDLTLWDFVRHQPDVAGYDALKKAGHIRLPNGIGV